MKILGKNKEEYVLQATAEEVANLIGYYYQGAGTAKLDQVMEAGHEIAVADMYKQLYDIAAAQKELREMALKLESFATLLRSRDPLIPPRQV